MSSIDSPNIETILEWFREYCIEEKTYEEKTASQYQSFIESYLNRNSSDIVDLSDTKILTIEKLKNFRQDFTGAIVKYAFGAFNTFLFDKGFIDEKRCTLENKKIINEAFYNIKSDSSREKEFLSPHDIKIIFTNKLKFNNEEDRHTFLLTVALSYFCLFNQKEVIALDISDINLENKTIKNIRDKSDMNFSLFIKMNETLYDIIVDYLKYRKNNYPSIKHTNLIIYKNSILNNNAFSGLYYNMTSQKNTGLHKVSKLSTGLILKSSILYMLRYSKNNVNLELTKLLGNTFFTTTYFADAFKEYSSSELELLETDEIQIQDISNYLPSNSYIYPTRKYISFKENEYSEEDDISKDDLSDYDINKSVEITSSKIIIQRLVRDSKLARNIKKLYKDTCLICSTTLRKSNGEFYSEAHHIHPYNRIHKGTDTHSNLIVLCSNCHTQFDDSYYAIHPETKLIHCLFEDDQNHLKQIHLKHELNENSLQYAWSIHLSKKQ